MAVSTNNLRRLLAWISLGIYWPMMFVMTHLPGGKTIVMPSNDKTAHFSGFLLLTLLYWLVRYGRERPSLRRKALYLTILLIALYAGVDEGSQELVEGRDGNIYDWLADVSGIFVGLILICLLRSWRQWLVVYWLALFTVTHWPERDGNFIRLPASWQQFQTLFVMAGYLALTFLFWRGVSSEPRFVVNKRLVGCTLFVLPIYAVVDEWIAAAMRGGFNGGDLISALAGILLGVVCSTAFARHNVVFKEDYDPYSRTWRQ